MFLTWIVKPWFGLIHLPMPPVSLRTPLHAHWLVFFGYSKFAGETKPSRFSHWKFICLELAFPGRFKTGFLFLQVSVQMPLIRDTMPAIPSIVSPHSPPLLLSVRFFLFPPQHLSLPDIISFIYCLSVSLKQRLHAGGAHAAESSFSIQCQEQLLAMGAVQYIRAYWMLNEWIFLFFLFPISHSPFHQPSAHPLAHAPGIMLWDIFFN